MSSPGCPQQLSEEQEELLKSLEQEFKDRYTENDAGFKATLNEAPALPPVIENWRGFTRQNRSRSPQYFRGDNKRHSYPGRNSKRNSYDSRYEDRNSGRYSYDSRYEDRNSGRYSYDSRYEDRSPERYSYQDRNNKRYSYDSRHRMRNHLPSPRGRH